MFTLQSCDASVFESAPIRLVDTFDIARPAGEVWDALVRDGTLDWCRMLGRGAQWTSPRPFGIGTTRTARVGFGALVLAEQYFRWDEGRRKSFFVTSVNVPVAKYFAEDYLIAETAPGACRFTWTIAYAPTLLGLAGVPVNAAIVRSLFADTRNHFAASTRKNQ